MEGSAQPRGTDTPRSAKAGEDALRATPAEVVPQRAQQRVAPVVRTKPTRRLQSGDLVCGQCGEGNPPTRRFCSRCGEELTTAETVRSRWWRRLVSWRRTPKALAAGTRPGQKGAGKGLGARGRGAYRKLRAAVATVLVTASVLYVFVPPLRGTVDRHFAHPLSSLKGTVVGWWDSLTYPYEDLPVQRSSASASLRNTPPANAFDGNTATFWAAAWKRGHRPTLTVHFEQAETIVAIVLHNGASAQQAADFLQPKTLRLRYGNGASEDVELAFSGDAQTLELDLATTERVVAITVDQVYAKKGLRNVALSEVEFKTRK